MIDVLDKNMKISKIEENWQKNGTPLKVTGKLNHKLELNRHSDKQ